ncbi:MAG: DUF3857 and transglutaminase domain-containing protein [Candidatus Cloacimonadota bacterium]|nr:DUF3857 and transglutaminase domain-containing protein [Candidatus Cloacimonadota bacterium]
MLQKKFKPNLSWKKLVLIVIIPILLFGCAKKINYSYLQNYNRQSYADADAVIVTDSTGINLEESGKSVATQHKIVKILSMKGKAMFSEATFGYFAKYDSVSVISAKVINPDGSVIEIPKEDIQDMVIPAVQQFYLPNVRMKKIIFPNIKEGSSVEYLVKIFTNNPPMENNFNTVSIFEGNNPIHRATLTINSEMALNSLIKNDVSGSINFEKKVRDGNYYYKWVVKNIPSIVQEPLMPPIPDVCKKVIISSVDSWKSWSKWYYGLCEEKMITTPEMDLVIDSLLVGAETRDDILRALYYYVSQNIRYIGTEMTGEKGGYEPFPAPQTFKNKYGVCRDKAALLAAMIQKAGFEAYTVLINPMQNVEMDIPHVAQFNHAITAVRNPDGTWLFIDATAENTSEFLMSIEQNKTALICTPEGEDILLTPKVPASENMFAIDAVGYISDDGSFSETAKFTLTGLMGMAFRQILTKLPADRRKMIFQMIVGQMIENAEIDTFYYSDPEDLNKPLEITVEFSAENYGLKLKDELSFSLPFSSKGTSGTAAIGGGGNPFALDERNYPLSMFTTMQTEVKEKIFFPEGYTIENLPEPINESTEGFSISSDYKTGKGFISHTITNSFNDYIFPPEEYIKMKKIIDLISEKSGQEVVLHKNGDE